MWNQLKSSMLFIAIMLTLTLMSFIVIEPYSIAPKDQQQTVELTTENGKVYRRQYNYSRQKWIGEWELC